MCDLQTLVALAERGGWRLIGLDVPDGGDVSAASLMRNVVGAFNEYERLLICERTKAALAIARSQGKRLGRPSRQSQQAKELATALRAEGLRLRKIGAALEEAGLRTPTGKRTWSPSSVQSLLRTARLDQEAAANAARYHAERHEQ